jgi:serine/threonine protein kinase
VVAKKLRVPAVTEEFLAKLRKEVKVRRHNFAHSLMCRFVLLQVLNILSHPHLALLIGLSTTKSEVLERRLRVTKLHLFNTSFSLLGLDGIGVRPGRSDVWLCAQQGHVRRYPTALLPLCYAEWLTLATDIGDKDVLRWARQVSEAMSYLHANGVVHRSLKTKNIIVDRQGNLKVKDYGLAPVKIFCEQAGAPNCPEVSYLFVICFLTDLGCLSSLFSLLACSHFLAFRSTPRRSCLPAMTLTSAPTSTALE